MGTASPETGAWHSRDAVRRLVSELLAEEIYAVTRRKRPEAEVERWPDDLAIDEEGLGFDSLSRLDAASHVTQFFHLQEVGLEDRLLMDRTLGKWIDIVETSLKVKSERLTFRTSGSTGTPKPCTHAIADLLDEAHAFADLLAPTGRVVSLVPPHHLFGFIFTVLLPAAARVPCLDLRASVAGLERHLKSGDIVAATPFHWALAERTIRSFPEGVSAVSSTALMPADLAARLKSKGLSRLVEVYGSSETSGIGWRDDLERPYDLLPCWTRDGDGLVRVSTRDDGSERAYALNDMIDWHGPRQLVPKGRKDGAIKIGGINVFPREIARRLSSHPDVSECTVSAKTTRDGIVRLEAVVVPRGSGIPEPELVASLEAFASDEFMPVERPTSFRIVLELARSSIGKLIPA